MAVPSIKTDSFTSGSTLPHELSEEIWAKVLDGSKVMQLARRVPVAGTGSDFQLITSEPVAEWVNEGAAKAVASHTVDIKPMTPHKCAVIECFSNELRDDDEALYNELVNRLPYAITKKFDKEVFSASTTLQNFDVLGGISQAQDIDTNVYDGFVKADSMISEADGLMNGIVLSPKGKSKVLLSKDTQGRPIFLKDVNAEGSVYNILGAPVSFCKDAYVAGSPAQLGIAGDWNSACYGIAKDIEIKVSDQANITSGSETLSLWQSNMFAVLVEFRIGFRISFPEHFVRLTGTPVTANVNDKKKAEK
ncbi:MAG: phage major capsid protein [Lachnospiraceae bacterium]|nr:phage major capsid protein [Lachnospiraceae bacterium]